MKKIFLGTLMTIVVSTSFARDISERSLSADTLRIRCEEGIARAEEYYNNGETEDEVGFLTLSQSALETCRIYSNKAGGWTNIETFISTGKKLCKQSSNQRSQLYHGLCILQLSQTVRTIVL